MAQVKYVRVSFVPPPLFFSASELIHTHIFSLSSGLPAVVIAISVSASLFLLFVLLCFFIQRKAKRGSVTENSIKFDENPVYGDGDGDPRMEVEDLNDYYSSDYEAGTGTSRTTDNNPYYE